jgi:hypothetical protein
MISKAATDLARAAIASSLDPKGNLYGAVGGTSGAGIVFEATP